MQTFLPYADFAKSAHVLDDRRLGKQRVEAWQILNALRGISFGWTRHPAVIMWCGYEAAIAEYGIAMCFEWRERGFSDSLLERFLLTRQPTFDLPPWIGDEAFHASHRAALLAKDFDWYVQFGWDEMPKIKYVWPSR